MPTRTLAVLAAVLTACVVSAAAEPSRQPRVLLIGDSIAGYYRPYVADFLKDRVNVDYSGNIGDTRNGLERIDGLIAKGPWDVIHFNWGLHDVKPVTGRRNNVPLEDYVKNLRELVKRMKATKARLIFATTTPVGPRAARRNEDVVRYNAAALEVMKEEKIAVDDLYAVAAPIREKIQHTDNVHFKPYYKDPPPQNDDENGCKILGKAVADSILKVLNAGAKK